MPREMHASLRPGEAATRTALPRIRVTDEDYFAPTSDEEGADDTPGAGSGAVAVLVAPPAGSTTASPPHPASSRERAAWEAALPALRRQWLVVLREWRAAPQRTPPAAAALAPRGLPPAIRGAVWARAIGNGLCVSVELYAACLARATAVHGDVAGAVARADAEAARDAAAVAAAASASAAPPPASPPLASFASTKAFGDLGFVLRVHDDDDDDDDRDSDDDDGAAGSGSDSDGARSWAPGGRAPRVGAAGARGGDDDVAGIDAAFRRVAAAVSAGGAPPTPSGGAAAGASAASARSATGVGGAGSASIARLRADSGASSDDDGSDDQGGEGSGRRRSARVEDAASGALAAEARSPSAGKRLMGGLLRGLRLTRGSAGKAGAGSPAQPQTPPPRSAGRGGAASAGALVDSDDSDGEAAQRVRIALGLHGRQQPRPPADDGGGAVSRASTPIRPSRRPQGEAPDEAPAGALTPAAARRSGFAPTPPAFLSPALQAAAPVGNEASVAGVAVDVPRTFPELAFFAPGAPLRGALVRVLLAYAAFRPDHGYAQGMSHLAAVLLLTAGQAAVDAAAAAAAQAGSGEDDADALAAAAALPAAQVVRPAWASPAAAAAIGSPLSPAPFKRYVGGGSGSPPTAAPAPLSPAAQQARPWGGGEGALPPSSPGAAAAGGAGGSVPTTIARHIDMDDDSDDDGGGGGGAGGSRRRSGSVQTDSDSDGGIGGFRPVPAAPLPRPAAARAVSPATRAAAAGTVGVRYGPRAAPPLVALPPAAAAAAAAAAGGGGGGGPSARPASPPQVYTPSSVKRGAGNAALAGVVADARALDAACGALLRLPPLPLPAWPAAHATGPPPPPPDEALAFSCLANLLSRPPLRWLVARDLPALARWHAAFNACLAAASPPTAALLGSVGATPGMFLHRWVMTLFTLPLGLQPAARLWDRLLLLRHPAAAAVGGGGGAGAAAAGAAAAYGGVSPGELMRVCVGLAVHLTAHLTAAGAPAPELEVVMAALGGAGVRGAPAGGLRPGAGDEFAVAAAVAAVRLPPAELARVEEMAWA